jgi:hypothetical protein
VKVEAAVNTGNDRSATVRCTAGMATTSVSVTQPRLSTIQSDSLALVDLCNATAAAAWTTKWTLTNKLAQWQGVTVVDGRVTSLILPANNLSGALPESFGSLTALQYCDLSGNRLSGAVPAAVNQLAQLTFLDLSDNTLTGSLPALSALTKLLVLDVSFNNFTALPALNTLTALEYLACSKNSLTGGLPSNWSALTKLIYMDASFNSFSGNIPAAWSALTKLQAFYLYKNTLDGSIPAYIANFTALKTLALDNNNLTGGIPDGLGTLPQLDELWLHDNRLGGGATAIPASLLSRPQWSVWEKNVCRQQSGYAFANCTPGTPDPAPALVAPAAEKRNAHAFKLRYQKR